MSTRRQEKLARVIRDTVSDAITNHLNDPRIEALVSITRVQVAADLHTADVYLSVFGKADSANNKTFIAIEHARSHIQSFVANRIDSKFCPVLRFYKDEAFHKTLETMKLIDQISSELKSKDSDKAGGDENPPTNR
jgi:ribosome-binding factor A